MSEDSNLLTRRQLIGLFGGVGVAVVGAAEGLEGVGSGEGNINAGRMALSEAFKAGDNLWHGPLSARSEVPQRDGVAFIQTDAGPNSDQYKIFHYDGGWVARGFNTPALTTDQLNNDVYHAHADDDLQTRINDAGDDSTLVVHGTHTLSVTSTSDGHGVQITNSNFCLYLARGATIKLADNELSVGDSAYLVKIGDDSNPYNDIKILGEGVIDGNKANNTVTGQRDFACVYGEDNLSIVEVSIDCKNSPGGGVYFRARDSGDVTNEWIWVHDCYLEDIGEGILFEDAKYVSVTGCLINGTHDQDGIETDFQTKHFSITGNIVYNTNESGIEIYNGSENGSVSGNTLVDCGSSSSNRAGISVSGGTNPTKNVQVDGNSIYNPGNFGIYVRTDANENTTNIGISDNTVFQAGNDGIHVEGKNVSNALWEIEVRDNTVSECDGHGIFHSSSRSSVKGNTCSKNGQNSTAAGIHIEADNQHVSDNHTWDVAGSLVQDYGIQIDGTASTIVEHNHLDLAATSVINKVNTPDVVIRHNDGYVTENTGQDTQSGDGSTTGFFINHGLDEEPTGINVWAESTDAIGDWEVDRGNTDASQFRILYTSAPPDGTDNLSWGFDVRVNA